MADTTMIPFADNGGCGWQAGLGGAIGGLVGSWFGDGWGGYGRRGGYGVAPTFVGGGTTNTDSIVLDSLSGISEQVGNVNTTILNSQAHQDAALAQGFAGVSKIVYDTANSVERTVDNGFDVLSASLCNANAQTNQNMSNGFANTISSINSNGTANRFELMNGVNQLQRSLDSCCCNTQNALIRGFGDIALENCQNTGRITSAINDDGLATRALINQQYITGLQTELCDAKAKIGSLESQKYTQAAISAQSVVFDQKLANAINTIVAEIKAAVPAPM